MLVHADSVAAIVEALLDGSFNFLLLVELLEELECAVTRKPQMAGRIRSDQFARLRDILLALGVVVPPIEQSIPAVTREPKDDYLMAYAVVGGADYLVTGDDDLLALKEVGALRIVLPPALASSSPADVKLQATLRK